MNKTRFSEWVLDTYGDFAGGAIILISAMTMVAFAALILGVAFAIHPVLCLGLVAAFPAYFWYKYKTRTDQ